MKSVSVKRSNLRDRISGKLLERMLFFGAVLYIFASYVEDLMPGGKVVTAAGLLLIFLVFLLQWPAGGTRIVITGYSVYIAAMGIFCLLSMLWAEAPVHSFNYARAVLILLVTMTILYSTLYREKNIDLFLKIIMWSGYLLVLYILVRYAVNGGLTQIIRNAVSGRRMADDFVNSNVLSMGAGYAVVINLYYIIKRRLKVYDLLIIPSVILIAASGSRKGILVAAIGVILLFVTNSYDPGNRAFSIFKIILVLAVLALVLYLILQLPVFAAINRRMGQLFSMYSDPSSVRQAVSIRRIYTQIGFDLFKEHPILGVGISNARLYIAQYYAHAHLHNNFAELLACGGIVGFSIYYSIYFVLFGRFIKFRAYRDKEYDICLIIMIIHVIMGYGSIQYYSVISYFFQMMFVIKSRQLMEKGTGSYECSV